jgi:preprotein translocase subunit SecG
MWYTLLVILLILDSVVLVVAILLQAGKGGGLAASFGGATSAADSLIGTRQAGNLLTKASWTCGGIFLFLAFVLQIASARPGAPASVLDKSLSTPAPAPVSPSTQKNTAVPLEAAPKAPAGAQATPPAGTQPATPAPKTAAPKTP